MRLPFTILLALPLACCSHVGFAQTMSFDVTDGLFANIPAGATNTPSTQMGVDNWYYKYDPTARFGQMGSPITRDPTTFELMELGSDGTSSHYGWAANAGGAIGDRGVFRNGSTSSRFPQSGTSQGTGVWANAENGVQLALEWRAPSDGTADVSFDLIGRDHAETDIEWHLATWDGMNWNNLGFTLVEQDDTPISPDNLAASSLMLTAGDSIYLYGQVADHDAFDGTVITGGIEFTPTQEMVPEPASVAIWSLIGLGLAGYGYCRVWRRK